MTIQDYVTTLRALTDWYEQRPDLPLPISTEVLGNHAVIRYYAWDRGEVASLTHVIGGKWTKESVDGVLRLNQEFGRFTVRLLINQDNVCTRRVVRYEEVPAQPAHTREVVEWDCGPLLGEVAEPA